MTALEAGIERLTALVLIATSLSHIAQPRAWVRFFLAIRAQGDAAGLLNAYVHAPLGFLILAFHQVWEGPGLLITLIGCALTLKGILYFLWPQLAARTMADLSDAKAWRFQFAGVFGLALGIAVGWIAIAGS